MNRLQACLVIMVLCALGGRGLCAAAITNTFDDMVVTASRLDDDTLSRIPANVTVFSERDIQNSPARHIDDILRQAPGVYVLRSVGMGYGLPVQIITRGIPGQSTTLLLSDGLPLNEAVSGFAMVNAIPVNAVRRIELVRGPQSSLYGANAFAGVANVLTLSPDQRPSVSVFHRSGNEGFREWGASASQGDRKLGISIDVGRRQIDNYLARDTLQREQWVPALQDYLVIEQPAQNFDYDDTRVLGKVTADLSDDTHLDIHARYNEGSLGYGVTDYRPLYPTVVDSTMETESAMLGAVLTSKLSDEVTFKGRTYYRWHERRLGGLDVASLQAGVPVFAPSRSETTTRDWLLDGAVDIAMFERQMITLGVDMQRRDADFSALRNADTRLQLPLSIGRRVHTVNVGVYAQDRITLSERVTALCGVRVDEHDAYGIAVSPKVGIVARTGDRTTLRMSVGQAYRAPSLIELYQPTLLFGNITFASNAELDPEYITTIDSGIDHQVLDSVMVHADVFYNDMTDLITKQISGSTLSYDNTDDAGSVGIEAGVSWEFLPECMTTLSFTEQRSENRETDSDLEHVPERIAALSVRCGTRLGEGFKAEMSLSENYVGTRGYVDLASGRWRELDDYWRTDAALKVTYRESVWVGFTIENASDEQYQEWPQISSAPGRLYAVEIGGAW